LLNAFKTKGLDFLWEWGQVNALWLCGAEAALRKSSACRRATHRFEAALGCGGLANLWGRPHSSGGCESGLGFAGLGGRSNQAISAEHRLDATHCLADAILILDQGEAHMVVTIVAKADPRRDRHLGFSQQLLGELQRAQVSIRFRNLRPDIHRGLGV